MKQLQICCKIAKQSCKTRFFLQTMIGLLSMPSHASLPDLLMTVASSREFECIKLRRGEKKALNAINKSHKEGQIRYCVPNPANPEKVKERINTASEKIFILVSLVDRNLM